MSHTEVAPGRQPPGHPLLSQHDVFGRLSRSAFRQRFRLGAADLDYLRVKDLPVVLGHARDLVARRLAAAAPRNDGRQTPMRGHPVFIAQHATATCCRGCLAKWHGIAAGTPLTEAQQAHVVDSIRRWLVAQVAGALLERTCGKGVAGA